MQHDDKNLPEVQLSEKTLNDIEARMARAVGDGIKYALNADNASVLLDGVIAGLQKSATENTGRFVLGGLRTLFRNFFLLVVLLSLAYIAGGWKLVVTIYNAFATGGAS